jgi:hypothetical protein
VDVADYHLRLEPGVVYTWSVSAILNPAMHAHDIVASATIMLNIRNWASAAGAARRALGAGRGVV